MPRFCLFICLLLFICLQANAQQAYYKADQSVQFLSYFGIGSESVQKPEVLGFNAANYAILQRNFPELVGQGIGVPTNFYLETIKKSGADKLITKLLQDKDKYKVDKLTPQLESIQKAIKAASLPKSLINQLNNAIDEFYKGKSIEISASPTHYTLSTGENQGPQIAFSKICTPKDMEAAIKEVYASFWSKENFKHRLEDFSLSKSHPNLGMGLLIKEAYLPTNEFATGKAYTIYAKKVKEPSIFVFSERGNGFEQLKFATFDSKWYQTIDKSKAPIFVDNQDLTPFVRQIQSVMKQLDPIYRKATPMTAWLDRSDYTVEIYFSLTKEKGKYELLIKGVQWYVLNDK